MRHFGEEFCTSELEPLSAPTIAKLRPINVSMFRVSSRLSRLILSRFGCGFAALCRFAGQRSVEVFRLLLERQPAGRPAFPDVVKVALRAAPALGAAAAALDQVEERPGLFERHRRRLVEHQVPPKRVIVVERRDFPR